MYLEQGVRRYIELTSAPYQRAYLPFCYQENVCLSHQALHNVYVKYSQALGSYVTNLAGGDLLLLRNISEVPTILLR